MEALAQAMQDPTDEVPFIEKCPICDGIAVTAELTTIRSIYAAELKRCTECAFTLFPNPTWLAEAYQSPINLVDTGYVGRNINCSKLTGAFITASLNSDGEFLDYGAGYGLFVRLMRDQGFNFLWQDSYAENLFARGFEWRQGRKVELVTAFEVFEHVVDPRSLMSALSDVTDVILFSTTLIPNPTPAIKDWWYYGTSHGQHISFYSAESLRRLGQHFDFQLITDHQEFHLFTRKPIGSSSIARAKQLWFQLLQRKLRSRESLAWTDHCALERKIRFEGVDAI